MYHVEWGSTRNVVKPAGVQARFTAERRKEAIALSKGLIWTTFPQDSRQHRSDKVDEMKQRILDGRGNDTRHPNLVRIVLWSEDGNYWVCVTREHPDILPGDFGGYPEAKNGLN
jgi:hypothetical protein